MPRTARALASGQDLPTVAGKAFRQLAAFGTASLQAALAPIIKTRQHRCVADAGAGLVLSPDTAATHPGRAVLRSRQVLAAAMPGRGPGLGLAGGSAHEPA